MQMAQFKQTQLKSSILSYLQSNIRVDKHLDNILSILCTINQPYGVISNLIIDKCSPVKTLKWLILFNRILISQISNKNGIDCLLENLKTKDITDFDKILTIKLIKPYILYLQKRYQIQDQENQQFFTQPINLTYSLLNTIWALLGFVDILYTFGRYYLSFYSFLIDFNITLGMDLKIIYNRMVKSISKDNRKDLLIQIQKIHQKMYIVYYNCYFFKYLKSHIPKWILTDDTTQSSSDSIKMAHQPDSSITISNFSNMSQSAVFQPKNQLEESRVQIIKSMQRIVSLFD